MNKEFPDNKQRYAVCQRQLETRSKASKDLEWVEGDVVILF